MIFKSPTFTTEAGRVRALRCIRDQFNTAFKCDLKTATVTGYGVYFGTLKDGRTFRLGSLDALRVRLHADSYSSFYMQTSDIHLN